MDLSRIHEFINIVTKELVDFYETEKTSQSDTYSIPQKIILKIIFFTLFLIAIIVSLFLLCTFFVVTIVSQLWKKLQRIMQLREPLVATYTEYIVANILYKVLDDNAIELDVTRPKQLQDIIPTRTKVSQRKNGYSFYHFIVHHPNNDTQDFQLLRDLITIKIEQILQAEYYNYPLLYNGICVLQCINVDNDNLHTGYYCIDILVVDNEPKYKHVQNITNTLQSTPSTDINDEEF